MYLPKPGLGGECDRDRRWRTGGTVREGVTPQDEPTRPTSSSVKRRSHYDNVLEEIREKGCAF